MNLVEPHVKNTCKNKIMTAQNRYIPSILTSLSTFLESALLSEHNRSEATALFAEYLSQKKSLSEWPVSELIRFLDTSEDHQTKDQMIRTALIEFVQKYPPHQTTVFLHEYLLALKADNCSASTIKNYRSDISQFFQFSQKSELQRAINKHELSLFVVLQAKKGLKTSSIRRKVISITQFGLWLMTEGVIPSIKELEEVGNDLEKIIASSSSKTVPVQEPRLHFTAVPTSNAPSVPVTSSHSQNEHINTRDNAQSNQNMRSRIKAGMRTLQGKLLPDQQQKTFLPYLNLVIILLFVAAFGIFGYTQFIKNAKAPLAYPTSPTRPNRVLQFQGRLTDTSQNPITTATDMAFRLYDANTAGSQLWSSGTCSVTPDQDGIFNTDLGSTCGSEISQDVFTENSNVWLEVEIATETLTPRQSIKTVPYALNSETLQGYPIDATGAATKNTVVTMNNTGDIILGEVSPLLKAVSGNFAIEAETLTLQTSSGTNGDITLSPDGTGQVQVQSDLDVTGYISAPGATLSATYAGGTALITKGGPSGTANIQEWQNNSGTALSVIDENGNIGAGLNNPSAKLHVADGGNVILGSDGGGSNTITTYSSSAGLYSQLNGNQLTFYRNGGSYISNSGGTSGSLVLRTQDSSTDINRLLINGGDGTPDIDILNSLLDINGNSIYSSSGNLTLDDQVYVSGNLGIGSTSPQAPLDVVGDIYLSSGLSTFGTAVSDGTIEATKFCTGDGETNCVTDFSSITGLWENTLNVYHPKNEFAGVVDLAVGGNSTASANILLQSSGNAYFAGTLDLGTNTIYDGNLTGDWNFNSGNLSSISTLAATSTVTFSGLGTGTDNTVVILNGSNQLTTDEIDARVWGTTLTDGSGTTNYISKWSDADTLTNSLLFDNGTNVGIGTSTPDSYLKLYKTSAALAAEELLKLSVSDDAGAYLSFRNATSADSLFSPQIRFQGSGSTVAGQIQAIATTDSGTDPLLTLTGQNTSSTIANRPILQVKNYTTVLTTWDQNGNVGIGTSTPVGLLNVEGAVVGKALSILNETGDQDILAASASGVTRFRIANNGYAYADRFTDISNSSYYIDPAAIVTSGVFNGNVGIGTNTPSYKLDVNGEANFTDAIRLNGDAGVVDYILTSSGGGLNNWTEPYSIVEAGYWDLTAGVFHPKPPYTDVVDLALGGNSTASANVHFQSNGEAYLAGNVGIGTSSPGAKLQLNTGSDSRIGQIIKANSGSQTANLQEWQNSSSTILSNIEADGDLNMRNAGILFNDANARIEQSSPLRLSITANTNDTFTNGLRLTSTSSEATATQYANSIYATRSVAGAATYNALQINTNVSASSGTQAVVRGMLNQVRLTGASTITSAYALHGRVDNESTGTITTAVAAYIDANINSGGGTITNNYGILVGSQNVGATNNYALYTNLGNVSLGDDLLLRNDNDRIQIGAGGDLDLYHTGSHSYITSATGNLIFDNMSTSGASIFQLGTNTTATSFQVLNNTSGSLFEVDGSGNVGIGSSSPGYKLDVNGEANFADAIRAGGDAGTSGYFLTSSAGGVNTWTDPASISGVTWWDNTLNVLHPTDEYASVVDLALGGTSTASATIHLLADGSAVFNQQGSDSDFRVEASGQANAFFVQGSDGNIGIGTGTPTHEVVVRKDQNANTAMLVSNETDNTGAYSSYLFETATRGGGFGLYADSFTGGGSLTHFAGRMGFAGYNGFEPLGLDFISNHASGDIRFFTGGLATSNERLRIDAAGNVGIGSTSPGYELDVVGELNLTDAIRVAGDAGTSGYLLTSSAGGANTWTDPATLGSVSWWDNTDNVLHPKDEYASVVDLALGGTSTASANIHLYADGRAYFADNVGIGIAPSTEALRVGGNGDILADDDITATDEFRTSADGTAADPKYTWTNDLDLGLFRGGTDILGFTTAGTEAMRIDASGNIGVGTTTPLGKLNLEGAAVGKALAILNETGDQAIFTASASGATKFVIANDGNVGIGTSNPGAELNLATGSFKIGTSDCNNSFCLDEDGFDTGFDYTIANHNGGSLYLMPDANVGIGTTTANAKLDVNGTIYFGTQIVARDDIDTKFVFGTNQIEMQAGGIRLLTSSQTAAFTGNVTGNLNGHDVDFNWYGDTNSDFFTLDAGTENVGIGTATPSSFKLEIAGDIGPTVDATYALGSASKRWSNLFISGNIAAAGLFDADTDTGIQVEESADEDKIRFDTAGSERMIIGADGNVGIGSTTPLGKLTIEGAAIGKALVILNETGNQDLLTASASGTTRFTVTNAGYAQADRFADISNTAYYIDPAAIATSGTFAGNVGIGTSNPATARLVVRNSSTEDIFNAFDGSTEVMTILDGGNVGIGTTAPLEKLHISNDSDADILLQEASNTSSFSSILGYKSRNTVASPSIVANGDGALSFVGRGYDGSNFLNLAEFRVEVDGTPGTNDMPGRLTFWTTPDGSSTSSERMRIDNQGNVGIGTINPSRFKLQLTGNIGPTTDDTYDLGSSTYRWQDLYLGPASLHIGTDGNEAVLSYNTTSNYLGFDPDGDTTNEVVILDSGNLGIGTVTPSSSLDIAIPWDNTSGPQITLGTVGHVSGDFAHAKIGTVETGSGSLGGMLFFSTKDNSGSVADAPIERMRIDSDGNVGIGSTNPTQKVDITSGNIQFSNSYGAYFAGSTMGTDATRIYSSGDRLHVRAEDVTGVAQFSSYGMYLPLAGQTYNLFTGGSIKAGHVEDASLDISTEVHITSSGDSYLSGGNVGINSTNPGEKLDVTGLIRASDNIQSGYGSGGVAMTINDGYGNANLTFNHMDGVPEQTGNAGRIEVNTDNTTGGAMSFEVGTNLTGGVAAALTEVMTILSTGNVGIGDTTPDAELEVNGDVLLTGNIYRNSHEDGFLVGGYNNIGANSTNTNPIFTIGSNYLPASTTLGNMYGIGYTHSNASFVSATPGGAGWGMYVSAGGVSRIFLNGTTGGGYFASNVGIGTTNPAAVLHTQGGYGTNVIFQHDGEIKYRANTTDVDDPPDIVFESSTGSQYSRIWSGLGSLLNLSGDSTTNADVTIKTDGLYFNNLSDFYIQQDATNRLLIASQTWNTADTGYVTLMGGATGGTDILKVLNGYAGHAHDEFTVKGNGTTYTRGSHDYAENILTSDITTQAADIVVVDPTKENEVVKSGHSEANNPDMVPTGFEQYANLEYPTDDSESIKTAWVKKTSKPYDNTVIGVISTTPGSLLGAWLEEEDFPGQIRPLALNGRTSIKVSTLNGVLNRGDAITTSVLPGIGMKSTQPGQIVGKVLESFDPSKLTCTNVPSLEAITWPDDPGSNLSSPCFRLPNGTYVGKAIVFVNIAWYDPTITLAENGQVVLTGDSSTGYRVKNSGQTVTSVTSLAKAFVANIQAGLTTTKDLVVQNTASIKTLSVESITINGQTLASYIQSITANQNTPNVAPLVSPIANNTVIKIASQSGSVLVTDSSNTTVATISSNGDTTLLGSLTAKNIVANSATISGSVSTDTLTANKTSLGSLLVEEATVSGTITATAIDTTSARIAALEAGIAQFEDAKAKTAEFVTATVSGTLYANNIDGLNEKTLTVTEKASLLAMLTTTDSIKSVADVVQTVETAGFTASSSADLNLTLADLSLSATDVTLEGDALFINNYFKVNGGAYVADNMGIGQSLFVEKDIHAGQSVTIANTLEIGENYIAYTATDSTSVFEIQPSGQGSLSLMAGLLILEENGTATINGSFTIENDATVKGTLFADLLKPTNFGNPLQVQVAGISDEDGEVRKSRFEIIDELGAPVATISAQGKAEFAGGLSVGSENLGTANLDTLDSDNRPILESQKTSGKAAIPSGTKEIKIKSSKVNKDSLIYVTPVGSTQNKVLYVKSQQEENPSEDKQGEFIVGFDEALDTEVQLNWWIVN